MNMNVVGYKPADEHWQKMKAVWDACAAARITPPQAVGEFFDYVDPGDAPGKEVEIKGVGLKKWSDTYREGYEVDITALPEGVRFLRFYCSW